MPAVIVTRYDAKQQNCVDRFDAALRSRV